MMNSSGPREVLLTRARAHTAVLALVAVMFQGCASTGPAPARPDDRAGRPSGASSRPAPATSAGTAAGPPRFRLPRLRPADHHDWAKRIPAGLRLDVHLPEASADFSRVAGGGGRVRLCGEQVFGGGRPRDRRVVAVSGPEYGEARDLRLFRDDRAADRFLRHALAAVSACPEQVVHSTTWLHEVRRSLVGGEASFTAVRTYVSDDGLPLLGGIAWELTRVGNAILLTASAGEYEPTTTLDPAIRRHAAEVAGIVEEMCVFSATPCSRAPVTGSSTHQTVVGPHGLGGIALGATAGEIHGSGGEVTDQRTASGCRIVDLWVKDGPDLVGNLEPGLGLSVIYVRTAARTDRGVGTGSPYGEVLAAYPDGEGDRQLYSAQVPGYDDRHWRFWFDRSGRVDEFMLLLDAQHCGG